MEAEPLETEKVEWEKERRRVLDEWSEIELKGAEALKLDVTHEPGSPEDVVAPEASLRDLYPLLVGPTTSSQVSDDIVIRKPETTDSRSTFDRILDVCLCRPAKTQLSPLSYTHKILIQKLAQTPYDNSNGTHWLLLSDYFNNVTKALSESSEDVKPARMGAHWVTVGFQSATPQTDFRGCGVLGLLQMHTFTQTIPPNLLRAIVLLATTEPNDFPLAVVSINVTSILLTLLTKGTFDDYGNENGLYPFFSNLHAATMAKFCSIYKSRNCSLAQTQTIFSEITRQLEKCPSDIFVLLSPQNHELVNTLL